MVPRITNAVPGITDYGEPPVIGRTPKPERESSSLVNHRGLDLGPAGPIVLMPYENTDWTKPNPFATIVRVPDTGTRETEADMSECGPVGHGKPDEVRCRGSLGLPSGGSPGSEMQQATGIRLPTDLPEKSSRPEVSVSDGPGGRSLGPEIRSIAIPDSRDIPTVGKGARPQVSVTSPFGGEVIHHSFLPRAASSTKFSQNVCALVGDRSKVDIKSVYTVENVHIDVDSFVKTLSKKSESALETFVKDPNSYSACIGFQATLPNHQQAPVEHQTVQYRAAPEVTASIEACAVAVIGDDNKAIVEADYGAPTGELDLAVLLRNDNSVAKAFAYALANRDDPSAQDSFDRQIAGAITPELLGSFLDGTDFDTAETKIRHYGSRIRERGAIAATVGEGNTTRSHVTLRAHKVAKLDGTALDNLADKFAPLDGVQYAIGTSHTASVRPPVWPPSGATRAIEALEAQRRREEIREELRRTEAQRRRWHLDGIREEVRRTDEIREEVRLDEILEELRRTRPREGEE